MFQFAKDGLVYWPVNLVARNDASGEAADVPVLLLFKIYTRRERLAREKLLTAAFDALKGAATPDATDKAMADIAALNEKADTDLRERIKGWKNIQDANGEPLEFSPAVLEALLDDDAQYTRIRDALAEASKGARAKNS